MVKSVLTNYCILLSLVLVNANIHFNEKAWVKRLLEEKTHYSDEAGDLSEI